jgi:ubiquinone/menaquinone biosynthesis C-methylase UbiE
MSKYVHGTDAAEQERLRKLNELTNPPFLAFLQPQPHEHVLEVGSGLGILAHEVALRVNRGRVIGIEYSPDQLAKVHAGRDNLEFVQGDAHSLPFADNTFDVVYCRYLLEHVADAAQVVSEIYRVLKPGGRACVQENDIAVFSLWPECPTWTRLWSKFGELQGILGGDAYVGRKLYTHFTTAGFSKVELSLQQEFHYAGMETFELWIRNALFILETSGSDLVAHGFATPDELKTVRAEFEQFLTLPDAASYFYWNRARATK